jgi:DNA invertase Pin-like site-specific DNA recombinase
MNAAVYVRRSTEQSGVADESKSVARQAEHAKAYAVRKGWTVHEAHVYADDGVSGALFGDKRPGLARLLNALSPRPPFQILIMSEESRLGRESIETGWTLKQIVDAGVRVFFYLEDRERTLDNAMDKVMLSLTSFASEMEREKPASGRTTRWPARPGPATSPGVWSSATATCRCSRADAGYGLTASSTRMRRRSSDGSSSWLPPDSASSGLRPR